MPEGRVGARQALDSVTRGTAILFLGTLAFVALNFVIGVVLARSLTIPEYGAFSVALLVNGLLISAGNLGLPQATARNIPYVRSDDERRAIVRTGFSITIPMAAGVAILLEAVAVVVRAAYGPGLLAEGFEVFAPAVACALLAGQIAAVFQGFEDVRPNAVFIQFLNPLLFLLFILLGGVVLSGSGFHLGSLHVSYTGALYAFLGSNVAMFAGTVAYYVRRSKVVLPPGPVAPGVTRRLVVFALPLLAVSLLAYVATSTDTLVLQYYDSDAVGTYTGALRIARLLQVGVGALGYIMLPVIARFAREDDTETARITYATATKWTLLTALPMFLVIVARPGMSLAFVFGDAYSVAAVPLEILLVGSVLGTLVGPAAAAQVSFGQTRALLYNTVAAAAADALLALVLVPRWGATGAAIAWATAAAIVPVLSMAELAVTKSVHPFLRHYVVPLVLTAVPVGLALQFAPPFHSVWILPVLVVLAALVFVFAVVATKSIDRGDRLLLETLEGILRRRLPLVHRLGRWVGPGPRP